jgi:hypothetical protein
MDRGSEIFQARDSAGHAEWILQAGGHLPSLRDATAHHPASPRDRVTNRVTIAAANGGHRRTLADDAVQVSTTKPVAGDIANWLRDEEAEQHESAAAAAIQHGPERLSQPRRPPQRPRSTRSPVVRIERQLHRVAELCRSDGQGGACGAEPGPAPAPGSVLGRPAWRKPGHRRRESSSRWLTHHAGRYRAQPSSSRPIFPVAAAASMPPAASLRDRCASIDPPAAYRDPAPARRTGGDQHD